MSRLGAQKADLGIDSGLSSRPQASSALNIALYVTLAHPSDAGC